jgi:Protein of unknown function (DUF1524)
VITRPLSDDPMDRYCPACGASVATGNRPCEACGFDPTPRPARIPKAAILWAGLVLGVAVLGLILMQLGPGPSTGATAWSPAPTGSLAAATPPSRVPTAPPAIAVPLASPGPGATRTVTATPLQRLAGIPTAAETSAGYDRALFVHWIDADGDGCDTRDEVLIAESLTPVTIGRSCAISGGSWVSAYDGLATRDPGDLQIDHMVPLKEAWDSGAAVWTADRRQAYANDLGDERSLRAVSASSNASKSDRDPADWMPSVTSFQCTYATDWVAVKVRWRLSVDAGERTALQEILGSCPAPAVTVAIQ